MKRVSAVFLAVVVIAAVAGAAFAYGNRFYGGLTPEQVAKMQQLEAESLAAMKPIMQQLYAKQAELNALIYSASPDKGKIEALAKELGALQGRLYSERANLNAALIKEGLLPLTRSGAGCGGYGQGGRGGMMRGYGPGGRGYSQGQGSGADCCDTGNGG